MKGAQVQNNDLVIKDRSIAPDSGKTLVAVVDGRLTTKRFFIKDIRAFF